MSAPAPPPQPQPPLPPQPQPPQPPQPPPGFVYLASQSPRRAQLLDQIGVAHRPLLPGADEDAEALEDERPGETPDDYVRRVALAKLDAALGRRLARGLPAAPVLCADTAVALDGVILGKPRDAAEATDTLRRLAGRTHRVLTAVAVAAACGGAPRMRCAVSESRVGFAVLSDAVIARYVAGGEPYGKAGAYAIQSSAAAWIERIEGSYSGIMGLPLYETATLLRGAGLDV